MKLEDENYCFCCGDANPIGLHLKFRWEDREYVTEFTPAKVHEGFKGMVHGGLIATVLDEVMARMLWQSGHRTVTAEMTVRLHRAARPGETLSFRARVVRETSRLVECSADAKGEEGIIAQATAKFLRHTQAPAGDET